MKPTENTANTASTSKAGLFARFCGILHIQGSGVSKIGEETSAHSAVPAVRKSRTRLAGFVATLCALLATLTFTVASALAARGHLFAKDLAGAACVNEHGPCAPGTFTKGMSGIAVNEETGDVYVVDKGDGLVTEFDESGGVVGTFGDNGANGAANGQLSGPRATAEGTLTFAGGEGMLSEGMGEGTVSAGFAEGTFKPGSPVVSDLESETGRFIVGQELGGGQVPAGTTIKTIGPGATLELSASATVSEEVHEGFSAASKVLTNASANLGGAFAVGQEVSGPGIEGGSTITAVNTGAKTLTLSSLPSQPGTVVLSAASKVVTGVTTSSGTFEEGKEIVGTGIPVGTTITNVNTGAKTLTLSNLPELAGSDVALTSGSKEITGLENEVGAFTAGQEIEGAGIPAHATITEVKQEEGKLQISAPVTSEGVSVKLIAHEQFVDPENIAVDNACALHKPEALTETTTPTCHEFDPSGGDVYVTDVGRLVVDKFSSTGTYITQLSGLGNNVNGVGVDPRGELWVGTEVGADSFNDAEVNGERSGVGAKLSAEFDAMGFAVDSEDDLYLHNEGVYREMRIFKVGPRGCTGGGYGLCESGSGLLNEAVGTAPSSELATELSTNDLYVDNESVVRRFSPNEPGKAADEPGGQPELEQFTVPGGHGTGIAVKLGPSEGSTVYVANSAAGVIDEYDAEHAGPPSVESESVSKVTGESATFEAEVNPRSEEKGEQPTSYHFEYTSEAQFQREGFAHASSVLPGGTLDSSFRVDTVAPVNVQGLTSGTVYRFRVVADNEHGVGEGVRGGNGEEVAHTFTTQTAGPLVLPDGREWEMVSAPNKQGAAIEPDGYEAAIQAAAGGGEMVFAADAPTESEPAGYATAVEALATRTPTGWVSRDLTIPHIEGHQPSGTGTDYRLFSEDLSTAEVQPNGGLIPCTSAEGVAQPCLSPKATEQTAFLQSIGDGTFTPLVTAANDTAEPFQPFGGTGKCGATGPKEAICGPQFIGGTADLEHVVIESSVALTHPAGANLYEWSAGGSAGGRLAPVTVLPDGSPTEGYLGEDNENERNTVSSDGSLVFWSTGTNAGVEGPLYVRDTTKGETLELTQKAIFEDASSNGEKVFYTEDGDLFECRIAESVAGKLECVGGPTELGSGVLGTIPGVSQDGGWVYFVASGALVEGRPVAGAIQGKPNLYVRHGKTTRLVAILSQEDEGDWADKSPDLERMSTRVSPNGRWFEFMSVRDLTGYDNRDAVDGEPDAEVFLYDGETGRLACASCDPSGSRPIGEAGDALTRIARGVVGSEAWNSATQLAADVPSWDPYRLQKALYQPRYLANNGRLFFNARDPLVAQAVGGSWDVYEYEPEGVPVGAHACLSSNAEGDSEVFKPERSVEVEGREVTEGAGCVGLISSGESGRQSGFLDASEDGSEVFFLTTAQLSAQDKDNAYDVYDAHECTAESPCIQAAPSEPPECVTESSCKPAPSTQPTIFAPSGSATFSGLGDQSPPPGEASVKSLTRAQRLAKALRSCKKDKKKTRRVACEKAARGKYGAKPKSSKPSKGRK